MKIGIDARSLEEEAKTGVARYLGNLLRQFAAISSDNSYILFFKSHIPELDYLKEGCFDLRLIPMGILPRKKVLWEQFCLPKALAGIDVLFSPSYMTPARSPIPTVVTIHDITYEVNQQWFSPKERLKMRTLTKLAAIKAHQIIAVSETTKADIIKHYKVEENRIEVIYEAADPGFIKIDDEDKLKECRKRYKLETPFILYVGSIFSRRNVPTIIKAIKILKEGGRELKLVLIGEERSFPAVDIQGTIWKTGVDKEVTWLDYVDEDDLIKLYNIADVFVYPSSYEGFGLPVLEAMACGTPVVTATGSSLGEVVKDAAVLIDKPEDPEELANAIALVIDDPPLAASLSEKGMKRAGEFSWESAARRTLGVLYDAVM